MSTAEQTDREKYPAQKSSWLQLYLHGLNVSVRGNAQAFGFSILITVSYGVVAAAADTPKAIELIGFALSAVAAFSLLNLLDAWLKTIEPDDAEHSKVLLVATATDFLSVGAGVGAALGITHVVHGWLPWVLVPFVASLVYCVVQALEIGVTRHETKDTD